MRIQICGRIAVLVDGDRRESSLPARQGRELLALLVVHRYRSLPRDRIVDALWPAGPPVSADAALNALLSKLRSALGSGLLVGKPEPRLVLPADAFVDLEAARESIHRAESAVAAGSWAAGWGPARVALHTAARGFLPGHDSPWVTDVRRELEELRLRALECVGAVGLGLGGAEVASTERSGRALVEAAPYRESGYRLLMQALGHRGEIGEALRVYEQLRCLLRDELGIPPGRQIHALHEQLLSATRPRRAPLV